MSQSKAKKNIWESLEQKIIYLLSFRILSTINHLIQADKLLLMLAMAHPLQLMQEEQHTRTDS